MKIPTISSLVLLIVLCTGLSEVKAAATRTPYTTTESTTAATLKDTGGVTVYYGRRSAEFQLRFAVQAIKDKCQDKCNALKDELEDEEDDRDRYCNAFDDYADCLQNTDKCYGSEDWIENVILRCGIGSQKVSSRGPPELIIRTGVAAVYAKCSPTCSNEYTRVDLAKDHKDLYCEAFATYDKCVKDKGCKVSQRTIDDILEHCNPSTTPTTDTSTDFSLRYAAHQVKARCGNKCLYEWQEQVKQEQDRGEYCSAFDQYAVCLQQTDVCFGANRLITKVQDLCRNGLSGFLTENKGAAGVDIREATERIHMKCPRACSNKYDLMRDVRNNKKEYCMAFVRYSDCLKDDWLCFVRQTAMDYVLDLCNADKGTE